MCLIVPIFNPPIFNPIVTTTAANCGIYANRVENIAGEQLAAVHVLNIP